MKLVTTVEPTVDCVTLDDAKAQLSLLDDDSHDARILRLIKAATRSAEAHTGMRAMSQTVRLELDCFPSGAIDLAVYPVASITSVAYDDANGSPQTLTANVGYYADLSGMFPRILPVDSWPDTLSGKPGAVRVTMQVGYASADLVPEDFVHAVLMRMSELFDQVSETVQGTITTETAVGFGLLLAPYRRVVV